MSAADDDDDRTPHPRETAALVRPRRGRAGAARCLSQRPHAACLADRRPARHRQGDARLPHGALRARASRPGGAGGAGGDIARASPPDHPVARRIAAQAHGDLLVLERTIDDKRQAAHRRSRSTTCAARSRSSARPRARGAGASAIVDAVDELNAAGANALLRCSKSRRAQSLLLLVSHAPGALLPTIRSRCRALALRPLAGRRRRARRRPQRSGATPTSRDRGGRRRRRRQRRARARRCSSGTALALRERRARPAGRAAGGRSARAARARRCARPRRRAARSRPSSTRCATGSAPRVIGVRGAEPRRGSRAIAEAGRRSTRAARDVEVFNLERKPLVFNVFGWLAEASARLIRPLDSHGRA